MHKVSTLLLGFSVLLHLFSFRYASAEIPLISSCKVSGDVQKVRLEEEWTAPCNLPEATTECSTDTQLSRPAGWWLTFKVDSVLVVEEGTWNEGADKSQYCKTLYPIGEEQEIFIELVGDSRADPAVKGQTIQGDVHSGFEKSFLEYKVQGEAQAEGNPPSCQLIAIQKLK